MKSCLAGIFVVSLVLFAATTASAEKLTLDDCIELALENRSQIIKARHAEDLARAGRRAALGDFLPSVSASYSYSEGETRDQENTVPVNDYITTSVDTSTVLFTDTNNVSYYVDFQRPTDSVFIGEVVSRPADQSRSGSSYGIDAALTLSPATWFNYVSARSNVDKARLDVIASEQDLIYRVKSVFYAHLASIENVSVQEDAVERSKEQLKLIESRFELGSAAKSDVLKQKVRYGNDQLSLLEARNSVTSSRADLAYTVGVDPNSDVEFSTEFRQRTHGESMEEAIQFGLAHQPGLLSAEEQVTVTKHDLSAARMGYLPSFRAFAGMEWSDGSSGDTVVFDSKSNSWSAGFTLSWNIFDGFSRERSVSYAKIQHNNARVDLIEARHAVALDVKKAHLDIDKATQQVNVNEENVEAATEDMRITQEKYNLGAATILEVLDAQVSLKTAQMQLISSQFDYNLAVAKLELAMGKM